MRRTASLTCASTRSANASIFFIYLAILIWRLSGDRARARDLLLQLDDPVDERLRGGRTARYIDVNGHDTVAATHDCIGIVVITAAVRARAHRDDPAWLGHLVIDPAQSGRHLVHERTRHDHHIRLARARSKHYTEAIEVVAGSARMHHLDCAAGEPESHRPERAGARPVDQAVELSGHETTLREGLGSPGRG